MHTGPALSGYLYIKKGSAADARQERAKTMYASLRTRLILIFIPVSGLSVFEDALKPARKRLLPKTIQDHIRRAGS